ncbi:MAG: hypothetical protein OIF50_10545 [Flavobacteriaceae bacterium]|nr:hypothetical protein [Flavobacteriaceae bacterium]
MSVSQNNMLSIFDKANRAMEIIDSMHSLSPDERVILIEQLEDQYVKTDSINYLTDRMESYNAALHRARNVVYDLDPNALMLRLTPINRYLEMTLGKEHKISKKVARLAQKIRGKQARRKLNDLLEKGGSPIAQRRKRNLADNSFEFRRKDLRKIIGLLEQLGSAYSPIYKEIQIHRLYKLYYKCGEINRTIDKHDTVLDIQKTAHQDSLAALKKAIIRIKKTIRQRFKYESEEYQQMRAIQF